jgi:uncharacterized Zn finger protein
MRRRSRSYEWGNWERYEPRGPREAKGGIKAQSKTGSFGKSWWAQRWIAVLEGFDIASRLGRGRSYARRGQVLNIHIDKGEVKAEVQGSSTKPYKIKINVKLLSADQWNKLGEALSTQAIFAAKLLAGEMPQEIEETFKSVRLSLFPEKSRDLETNCSCPDWSNPCKHIAAVYYLLGEEFDRDPFLIFKLRGLSREELIPLLGEIGETLQSDNSINTPKSNDQESIPLEPITPDIATFWSGAALPDDFFGEVSLPPVTAALPKRLGNFPFWRGTSRFIETLESIYSQSALRGLDVFVGEQNAAESAARK